MNQQIKITRHKRKAVELEIDGILTPVGKIQPTSSEGLLPRPINLRGREVLINPIRYCEERSCFYQAILSCSCQDKMSSNCQLLCPRIRKD